MLRIDHDPDKHDDRAIALALAAYRLARQPWLQPEEDEPEIEDPRRRALVAGIKQDAETDFWVDEGEIDPAYVDLYNSANWA